MEVLAQEYPLSVISGLQDSAMYLSYIKQRALSLEYLICTATDNEF